MPDRRGAPDCDFTLEKAYGRVPGQVPGVTPPLSSGFRRLDPAIERMLTEKPPDFTLDAYTDRPIATPRAVVSGFGFTPTLENMLAKAIGEMVGTAPNELVLRQRLMEKMLSDGYPFEARQLIFKRSLAFFRHTLQKSGDPEIFKPEELHPDRYPKLRRTGEKKREKDQRKKQGLEKAGGEGSRGGRVIGHTSGGKPVYASETGSPSFHANNASHAAENTPTKEAHERAAILHSHAASVSDGQQEHMHQRTAAQHKEAAGKFDELAIAHHQKQAAHFEQKTTAARMAGDHASADRYDRAAFSHEKIAELHAAGAHEDAEKMKTQEAGALSPKAVESPKKTGVTWGKLFEKAEARGGKYHRRVTQGGEHRYYYDEKKYEKDHGSHLDGAEARHQHLSSSVLKCVEKAGEAGCDLTAFAPLVKKHGAQAVHDAVSGQVGKSIGFKAGRFYKKPGDVQKSMRPDARFMIGEPP
jgi:hypothetical protein